MVFRTTRPNIRAEQMDKRIKFTTRFPSNSEGKERVDICPDSRADAAR